MKDDFDSSVTFQIEQAQEIVTMTEKILEN